MSGGNSLKLDERMLILAATGCLGKQGVSLVGSLTVNQNYQGQGGAMRRTSQFSCSFLVRTLVSSNVGGKV